MENILKFEDLPNQVAKLREEVGEMKYLLEEKIVPKQEPDNPILIDEVCKLTDLVKPTIYGYCQQKEIPYHKKAGRLYFFKSEIIEWIKTGKQKTLRELQGEAENYLSNKKKGLHHGK